MIDGDDARKMLQSSNAAMRRLKDRAIRDLCRLQHIVMNT